MIGRLEMLWEKALRRCCRGCRHGGRDHTGEADSKVPEAHVAGYPCGRKDMPCAPSGEELLSLRISTYLDWLVNHYSSRIPWLSFGGPRAARDPGILAPMLPKSRTVTGAPSQR